MKKIILSLLILFSFNVFSQTTLTQEQFNNLPSDVKEQITNVKKKEEVKEQVKEVGEWASLGKNVGIAVNESLSAITETARDFSKTDLGKLTIALVVYKVIGRDVIGFVVGGFWIIFSIMFYLFIHKKYCKTQMVLETETYNEKTKERKKQWRKEFPNDMDEWKIGNVIILGINMIIFFVVIFA